MNKPEIREDGSCSECGSGHQCEWHQIDGVRKDRERSKILREVCARAFQNDLAAIGPKLDLSPEMLEVAHRCKNLDELEAFEYEIRRRN